MSKSNSLARFRRYTIYSLISVYLLILAGGIVRSTGSGMGCPDWPRCFGQWVPPTSAEELPEDYKEVFKAKRHQKNEKLARYLEVFSFHSLANQVLNEDTDPVNLEFNVKKTYIEYINRVAGVITGFLILLTFVFSIFLPKDLRYLTYLSFLNLLLVSFQGWIGSLVVSTDLLHWMVTIHMLLTVVIIAILIYAGFKTFNKESLKQEGAGKGLKLLVVLGIFTSMLQMIWGTQVREEIDLIAKSFQHVDRHLWIDNLADEFFLHRSFSWIVVILNVMLVNVVYKRHKSNKLFIGVTFGIVAVVLAEVVSGVVLNYFSIPAFVQPVHLFLAFVIFGLQYFFLLVINFNNSQVNFSSRP